MRMCVSIPATLSPCLAAGLPMVDVSVARVAAIGKPLIFAGLVFARFSGTSGTPNSPAPRAQTAGFSARGSATAAGVRVRRGERRRTGGTRRGWHRVGVADAAVVVVAGCSVTWVWDGPGFPDRARPTISPSVRRPPPRGRSRRPPFPRGPISPSSGRSSRSPRTHGCSTTHRSHRSSRTSTSTRSSRSSSAASSSANPTTLRPSRAR